MKIFERFFGWLKSKRATPPGIPSPKSLSGKVRFELRPATISYEGCIESAYSCSPSSRQCTIWLAYIDNEMIDKGVYCMSHDGPRGSYDKLPGSPMAKAEIRQAVKQLNREIREAVNKIDQEKWNATK